MCLNCTQENQPFHANSFFILLHFPLNTLSSRRAGRYARTTIFIGSVTEYLGGLAKLIFIRVKHLFISQRFHITYVPESSSYRLRIEDIQETDGAIYQCQVLISLTDKEVAEVPLIVRQPPVISDNSTRSVVATEGQES